MLFLIHLIGLCTNCEKQLRQMTLDREQNIIESLTHAIGNVNVVSIIIANLLKCVHTNY